MIVAKKFHWEAAHRIPWHQSKCKNLHGHSYKMMVEMEGEPDAGGIVIDFNDVKKMVQPFIDLIDHATIISKKDTELIELFERTSWKRFILPYDSTAENLCRYVLDLILDQNKDFLLSKNIHSIGIQLYETESAYARLKINL